MPSSLIAPANSRHTGVGATAYASASQKWNGTTAAFTNNPAASRQNATTTSPSEGPAASASEICARFSAPVRPYTSAMPVRIRNDPIVFVTAKLSDPSTASSSSILYPASANAATLINSKKTNMLKRSPERQKPTIPARNSSIRVWKCGGSVSRYRHIKTNAATISTEQRVAKPAPNASTTNATPTAIPRCVSHPPNQYTSDPDAVRASRITQKVTVARVAASATTSATALFRRTATAVRSPAATRGTTTVRGATVTQLSPEGAHLVGVERPEPPVSLHGEGQEQRDHRGLHDDIGERQSRDDRVNHVLRVRDVGVDRRGPAGAVADRQQQHIGRRLHDREAHDQMHEISAGDNSVEADQKQPGGNRVGQEAHSFPFCIRRRWSRNSPITIRSAPMTSRPTAMFSSGMAPPDTRWLGAPNGRKFSK